MKTLKQLFKEYSNQENDLEIGIIYTSITETDFKNIVKEWLTQKRQENEEWLQWWQKEFQSTETPASYEVKKAFIDKLLEDANT